MESENQQGSNTRDVTKDEGDSETESFVDALEDLVQQGEQPVTFEISEQSRTKKSVGGNTGGLDQSQVDTGAKNMITNDQLKESETSTVVTPSGQSGDDAKSNNEGETCSESSSSSCDSDGEEAAVEDIINQAVGKETDAAAAAAEAEAGKEEDIHGAVDEEAMREKEEKMSPEEKEALRDQAQAMKAEGNERFKAENYQGALEAYTDALMTCPLCYSKERSIMYSNRAATKYKMNDLENSIEDCSKALELNPNYLKALLRRAELYEKTEKLEDALTDYQKALEMDPSLAQARQACMVLPDKIKERNEKMKEEMFGKLKDLGNLVLRPFGLSTDNFKLQQDPNTGSYSVNFQQTPSNGK